MPDLIFNLNLIRRINELIALATEDSKSCWCGELSAVMAASCLLERERHLVCVVISLVTDWSGC